MVAYNFSAGPSTLPKEVLKKAQKELLNFENTQMSIMELSHRSETFERILHQTKDILRKLMNIPKDYHILFLQGGATTQFSMVPLNFMHTHHRALYVDTGEWSKKALQEARKYGHIEIIASSAHENYRFIPQIDHAVLKQKADYCHITTNNTLYGTRFQTFPNTGDTPLVGDCSSNILSEEIDVKKFGLLYAGAQKNLGIAGVCVVIVREDLVGKSHPLTPCMLNYENHVKNFMYNTPPTFAIYICKLVLEWLSNLGGIGAIQQINEQKANILYDYLDTSERFHGTAHPAHRSIMNIPFVTGNENLDALFLKNAEKEGFFNLKGHRLLGGMRASIYNAMPVEGVLELVKFMRFFEQNH